MNNLNKPDPQSEQGQALLEYSLFIGLIAFMVLSLFIILNPQIRDLFVRAVSEETVETAREELKSSLQENDVEYQAYQTGIRYEEGDVVKNPDDDKLYVAVLEHTAYDGEDPDFPFDRSPPHQDFWELKN